MSNARAARRRGDKPAKQEVPDIALYFNGAWFDEGDVKQHTDIIAEIASHFPVLKTRELLWREYWFKDGTAIQGEAFPHGQPVSVEFSTRVTPEQQRAMLLVINTHLEQFRELAKTFVAKHGLEG